MDEQYAGITDLTHYMNGRPIFTAVVPPPPPPPHYDMAMLGGGGGMVFRSDSATGTGSTTASLSACGGGSGGGEFEIGGGGGNCRWPRQETLTLLEVRSSLDCKFKEANQKGPLWDEVSRIMCEEHGYQRSGKKCREKFENLYKYYKKTKDGKAGRQDGKHYRFFRQLEALYGETSTSNTALNPNLTTYSPDPRCIQITESCGVQARCRQSNNNNLEELGIFARSPGVSNNSNSGFDTCSSGYSNPNYAYIEKGEDDDDRTKKKRVGKRGWKIKIKEFVDAQMRKVMEKQEEWMEKMMRSIEQKEQERVLREEQWRKEEAARFEKEQKFWANERAWMESRDSALMEALHKLNHKESSCNYSSNNNGKIDHDHTNHTNVVNLMTTWGENELTRLIQLRTSMETRFECGSGQMEELLWEEIASKMACLGYNRNGVSCKTKWDGINEFLLRTKKRKDNTRTSNSYPTHHNDESLPHTFHHPPANYRQGDDQRLVLAPSDGQNNDGSHRFVVVDHENMWDGYGMKLRMSDQDH